MNSILRLAFNFTSPLFFSLLVAFLLNQYYAENFWAVACCLICGIIFTVIRLWQTIKQFKLQ